jgi:hypothetical protein
MWEGHEGFGQGGPVPPGSDSVYVPADHFHLDHADHYADHYDDGAEFGWPRILIRHLNQHFSYAVLPFMAEEKNKSKDIVLWIITVVLIAVAIYWYYKPR